MHAFKTTNIVFDLQLFAEPNTQVTTLSASGNDLSPEMKLFYNTQLLQNAREEHYFNQFGQKQALPKGHGNTIEWRKMDTFKNVADKPLTEGVTPDGNKANVVKISQSTKQYGDYTTVSDRLEVEAVDPIISMITEEHAAQAGDTLDIVTRNEVITGTNVYYAGGKTSRTTLTASDLLTSTLVNQVATFMRKNHVPKINGDYVAIIHPSVAYDLRESDGWLEVHKYAKPEEVFNGEIGKLHGVRFVEDPMAKVWKNSGVSVYATIFLGADAYGIIDPEGEGMEVIVKGKGSAGTADPLNQRSTVGWKATHAAKILYDERIVRVESGSAFPGGDDEN